jgi:hypothetical protein
MAMQNIRVFALLSLFTCVTLAATQPTQVTVKATSEKSDDSASLYDKYNPDLYLYPEYIGEFVFGIGHVYNTSDDGFFANGIYDLGPYRSTFFGFGATGLFAEHRHYLKNSPWWAQGRVATRWDAGIESGKEFDKGVLGTVSVGRTFIAPSGWHEASIAATVNAPNFVDKAFRFYDENPEIMHMIELGWMGYTTPVRSEMGAMRWTAQTKLTTAIGKFDKRSEDGSAAGHEWRLNTATLFAGAGIQRTLSWFNYGVLAGVTAAHAPVRQTVMVDGVSLVEELPAALQLKPSLQGYIGITTKMFTLGLVVRINMTAESETPARSVS